MTSKAGKQAPFLHGVPIVASTTERDALFGTPDTDQRVMIRGTGDEWVYDGTTWLLSKAGQKGSAATSVFNVAAYGAKTDGSDAQVGLNAALAAAVTAGGGVVTGPAGTYTFSSYAPSYTDRILYLNGGSGTPVAITLSFPAGTIFTTALSANASTATLFLAGNLEDCVVEGIDFRNTHGVTANRTIAINADGGSSNTIKRLTIQRNVFRNHSRTLALSGIEGLAVLTNKFLFTNGRDSGSTNLGDPGVAIWCFVQANGQTSGVRVIGNYFDGCTSGDVSTNTNKFGQDGFIYGKARGWVIVGNTIKRHGVEAIYVDSRQAYEATYAPCTITGNIIDSLPPTGESGGNQYSIRCDEHHAVVEANTLHNTIRGVWVSGASLAGPVIGSHIVGNKIHMLDAAAGNSYVGIYNATTTDALIAENSVWWNTATTSGTDLQGVQLVTVLRAKISGNKVRAATKPGGKTLNGFWFEGATTADIECEDNTTDNCHNDFWGAASLAVVGGISLGRYTSRRSTNYVNASGTLAAFTNTAPCPPTEAYPGVNSFTYTPRSSSPVQRITGTLAGNQTVTLSTTGAIHGDQASFIKTTASGAFTCAIGSLKTIPSATAARVDITYDRTFGWQLSNYAPL